MLGQIQEHIVALYCGDFPDRYIDISLKLADACSLTPAQAAIHALTGAYTADQIDAKNLTPRGYETLTQSINNMRDAAQNHNPDDDVLLAAYDRAIANLQDCYESKQDRCFTFKEIWQLV